MNLGDLNLGDLLTTGLVSAILIFVRIAAIFSLAPVIGERSVPQRVKLGAALAATVFLFPILATDAPPPASLPAAILAEATTGLLFGLIFRLLVVAIQMAGIIIAQSGSLSQMFPGVVDDAAPAISALVNLLALAAAAAFGIQYVLIEVIVGLYAAIPMGESVLAAWSAETLISTVSQATVLAFRLSAGFVVASLLYNLVIGFANRIMPQLMLTMIGAPVISLGALGLLTLTFPMIISAWLAATETLLAGYR